MFQSIITNQVTLEAEEWEALQKELMNLRDIASDREQDAQYIEFLESRADELDALQMGGVDDWEGYDEAIKNFRRYHSEAE